MSIEYKEEGIKTYIYALMDEDENIIYVGKSNTPKERLGAHKHTFGNPRIKMKVLDYFYDIEQYWVSKLALEGHNLFNRELFTYSEDWEKGDIIDTKPKTKTRVFDKEKNIIYDSLYALSKAEKIDISLLKTRINNPEKYKEFKK